MKYKVRLTDQTRQCIEDLATWVAVTCHAPLNAARWLTRVMHAIDSLALWPRRCAIAEESQFRPYEIRQLNVGGYLLLFTISDKNKTVWIVGFRHGRMKSSADLLPDDMEQLGDSEIDR